MYIHLWVFWLGIGYKVSENFQKWGIEQVFLRRFLVRSLKRQHLDFNHLDRAVILSVGTGCFATLIYQVLSCSVVDSARHVRSTFEQTSRVGEVIWRGSHKCITKKQNDISIPAVLPIHSLFAWVNTYLHHKFIFVRSLNNRAFRLCSTFTIRADHEHFKHSLTLR